MTEVARAFAPDWVSPPGSTVADLIEERGWTQQELAQRSGFTTKHISLLINGKAPITEDTAVKLERVLGSTMRFWLTREAQYREALARVEERKTLSGKAEWLQRLPIREMVRFGWIRLFDNKGDQVRECLRFFGVASIDAWETRYRDPLVAFRASTRHGKQDGAVAAWLRQGERQAEGIACQPFDKAAFKQVLMDVRRLTNEGHPGVFIPRLVEACAGVGVAVVVAPAPKGCPVSGATRWLSGDKALLVLSLRHKSNDHFWFSFFHEAGHLLLHGKKLLFVDADDRIDGADEDQADAFASNWLISAGDAARLGTLPRAANSVQAFAKQIGVAPGIVVGRMQKDGLLPWTHLNSLKVRYRWAHER
jgi:HTH-type transcriptional regulator / antitoxin HigA